MSDEPAHNTIARIPAKPETVVVRPAERKAVGRRSLTVVRRWFRDTFSREQIGSALRSLVWVVPLTALIWVYAEREQVDEKSATFYVEVRSGAAGQVAHLPDQRAITVLAKVSGPKARVGQAIESLQAGAPVQVFIGGGRQDGEHDFELSPLIERDPRLRDNGLSVVSCEPRLVRVKVDTLVEKRLDVKLPPDVARLLNAPAVFDPPQISVSAPASAFQQASKGSLYVEAELPQEMQRAPGRHGPTSVRVSVPALGTTDVTLRQSSVMATVDVRDADERLDLKSVPITVRITPEISDGYKVVFPRFVQNVPVYGSPDRIKQLKTDEVPRPEAMFRVNSADLTARKGTRKLDYILPEGITIREEDKQNVAFEIVPRDGAQ